MRGFYIALELNSEPLVTVWCLFLKGGLEDNIKILFLLHFGSKMTHSKNRAKWRGLVIGWLVVRFESNCPLVRPGTIGGVPSVGVFLRDPSPYLREFQGLIRENFTVLYPWSICREASPSQTLTEVIVT